MAVPSSLPASELAQSVAAIQSRSRLRDAAEIFLAFVLLEIALWTPKSVQLWFGIAMLGFTVLATIFGWRSATELGLTLRSFRSALIVLPYSLVACGLLLLVGWVGGWLHGLSSSIQMLHGAGYVLWAFQQEFMAQSFYFVRFESLVGSRRALWVTAALFSLAHIPNPVLLPATFVAGLGFSGAFRRYRNLYPITIAHALLGLALSAALPMAWTHQMRVGLGYLLLRH